MRRRGRPFNSLPLDIEPPWSDPPEPDDDEDDEGPTDDVLYGVKYIHGGGEK